MNWENLLYERCPICSHKLMQMEGWWQCEQKAEFFQKCKFSISNEKFQNICYELDGGDEKFDRRFDDQDEEMEPF